MVVWWHINWNACLLGTASGKNTYTITSFDGQSRYLHPHWFLTGKEVVCVYYGYCYTRKMMRIWSFQYATFSIILFSWRNSINVIAYERGHSASVVLIKASVWNPSLIIIIIIKEDRYPMTNWMIPRTQGCSPLHGIHIIFLSLSLPPSLLCCFVYLHERLSSGVSEMAVNSSHKLKMIVLLLYSAYTPCNDL